MASPSRMSCFHCRHSGGSPDHFRNGWRLRSGDYAQLCTLCASEYEGGRFCETFHSNDDGWRECGSCGKARNQCLSLLPEIGPRETYKKPSGEGSVEVQHWPQLTLLDLQKVSRNPKATITPLFEKILSATDADLKLARLIIPTQCAEAFFPNIYGSHGLLLKIQDMEGSEWEFHYCYWLNSGSKIYVLEGLRDYMVAKNWQPGDTVTFYRVEPLGNVVMGLRKTSAPQLPRNLGQT